MLRVPQRDRTNSSPVWRQVIVFVVGGVTLTVGLVMLVLPGTCHRFYTAWSGHSGDRISMG